jgi:hypothetical protein
MIGKANRRNREVQVPPIHVGSDKIRSKRRSANGPTTRSASALSKVATHPASHERHFLRDPFGAGFDVSRFRAELGHTHRIWPEWPRSIGGGGPTLELTRKAVVRHGRFLS